MAEHKLDTWYMVTKGFLNRYDDSRVLKGTFIKSLQKPSVYSLNDHSLYVKALLWNGTTIKNCIIIIPPDCLDTLELVAAPEEVDKKIRPMRVTYVRELVDLAAGNISVGSDPEIFVTDKDGKLLPAFDFLEREDKKVELGSFDLYGRAKQPRPYWDGFQAEFKLWPCTCHAYVTDCIHHQLVALLDMAQHYKDGAKLDCTPTWLIPPKMLKDASNEHVALGCMPSQNAYGMSGIKPESGKDLPVRFAGFHIHHGDQRIQKADLDVVVKCMDNIVGVMSVAVLDGLEMPVRRQYYGLAGEYRKTTYGLEYRVLSSAVMWHPALTHLHLDMARAGCQIALAGLADVWEGSEDETISIINDLDVDAAKKALKRNKTLIKGLLTRYYSSDFIFDPILMKGIKEHIDLDVKSNWHLRDGKWVVHTEGQDSQMHKFAQTVTSTKTTTAMKPLY